MAIVVNGIDYIKPQTGNLNKYKTTLINGVVTVKIRIPHDMMEA